MITVRTTRPEITTERKVWNPVTRQNDVIEGKIKLVGVKIEVTNQYGENYAWKCYVRKGQRGSWKREQCNSASKTNWYTEKQVLENLVANDGIDGIDKMIEANQLLDKLCGK